MRPANLMFSDVKDPFAEPQEFQVYWANCIMSSPTSNKADITDDGMFGTAVFNAAPQITLGAPSTVLVDGDLGEPGEIDVYEITLVAGQTYMFSLRGTGEDALADSYLILADSEGNSIFEDDDGGDGTNSLITFTATTSGSYLLGVAAYPGSGLTGTYTLDAIEQPDEDVVPDTFEGAVELNLNGVTFGFIDSDEPGPYGPSYGEVDTYTFEAQAGMLYTFELAGGATDFFSQGSQELDTRIALYDSDGNLLAQNDDISFPGDISSRISFFAAESGTYYLDAFAYAGATGGFTIVSQVIDISTLDPLDSINWVNAENVQFDETNTAYVYFAVAGETFGEEGESFGWNAHEMAQVMEALEQYEIILGVNYEITTDSSQATFRLITTTSDEFGAYFYPQDPAFGTQQGIGGFNVDSGGWNYDQQQGLLQGGFDFAVILHEFGHAHGLAHPHDRGGGSDIMLGVTGASSYGIYNLNQGVYTVMSYNDAWDFHPDGPSPLTGAGVDNGWSGTLSAFDIAMLQRRYGVHAHATGNDVYELKDVQARGTFYSTIWDTGGTDEIRYSGNRNARIDLLAATLDYTPTGGGVMSFVDDIKGGYTIANGVVIENATAGNGNDVLMGNAAANILTGNGGDDFLMGRGGADVLNGGNGFDTASYALATSGVIASLTGGGMTGEAAGDKYVGIEKLEGSNFADMLSGGGNHDTLSGLDGDDQLSGGGGNDTMDGGAGNDTLDGGGGNDTLNGGDGSDSVDGGGGNDIVNGGAGDDILTGGGANDIFAFTEIGGNDVITDFRRGYDRIDLSGIDAVEGGSDNAFTFIGSGAFTNVAGQLRSYSQDGAFFLAGDVDGDGAADFTIQLTADLQARDIIL